MSPPANRYQAVNQARDLATPDKELTYPVIREQLAKIFTMLDPWARKLTTDLVDDTREVLRHGDRLPVWAPEQWITAIMVQLGFAAMNLHTDAGHEDRETGILNLRAVAASAMDAIDALQRDWVEEE